MEMGRYLLGLPFSRRVLSATELPRAATRIGRSHLPVLKNEGYFLAERGRLCVSRIPFGDRPSDVVSYRPPNFRGLPPVPIVLLIFRASGGEGEVVRFTHPLRGPSFGRRALSVAELPRAAARIGRPSHL